MKFWLLLPAVLIARIVSCGELIPTPELTHLSPLGAQAGVSTAVTVTGSNLDGATDLIFIDATIKSEPKKDDKGKVVANVLVVNIPKNAKPGIYDARVRGRFGLSNPRRFCIGNFPEAALASVPNSMDKAAPVALNSTVNATTAAGQRAWFKFHAGAQQRVFVRVEAPDTRLEAQFTLSDAAGKILQRSRNAAFEFNSPADGDYFLQLHDLLFRGGGDCRFRLTLATEPLAADRPDTMASCFIDDAEFARVAKLAHENADAPGEREVTPPFEAVSLFPASGQAATFTFAAKKGDVVWIEALSHRLGYASDPEMVLEKIEKGASGEEKVTFVAEAGDLAFSASAAGYGMNMRDGVMRFEAKDDGSYRVTLRDLFNTAPNSPRLPYRFTIRKETPDFQLVAVPDQGPRDRPPKSIFVMPPTLRRGGVASVRVFVQRQDGFAGDIALNAENLPPGVTCLGAILGTDDECAALTFFAGEKAEPAAGLVKVIGTAKINGQDVKRFAHYGTSTWSVPDTQNAPFRARMMDSMGLAVVAEDAPVLLEPETAEIEAKVNSKITVKLKVTRRGYDELFKVRAFVIGDQDKSAAAELEIPAKAATASLEFNLQTLVAKPGEHTFVIHGNAERVKYKRNADDKPKDVTFVVVSRPIRLKVIPEPPKK